ncbi:leucine-rich repeat protein [Pelomyxa schiedti]|nr:leucine-rich repeat protein [Pelomyxa schiedti]
MRYSQENATGEATKSRAGFGGFWSADKTLRGQKSFFLSSSSSSSACNNKTTASQQTQDVPPPSSLDAVADPQSLSGPTVVPHTGLEVPPEEEAEDSLAGPHQIHRSTTSPLPSTTTCTTTTTQSSASIPSRRLTGFRAPPGSPAPRPPDSPLQRSREAHPDTRTVILKLRASAASNGEGKRGSSWFSQLIVADPNKLQEEVRESLANSTTSLELHIIFRDLSHPPKFPPSIFEATWLKSLLLPSNGITEIPAEFSKLVSLQLLDLSNNLLTSLPDSFSALVNISVLRLSTNEFSEVPLPISSMTHLDFLALGNNKLQSVPSFMSGLTSLRELVVSCNCITHLPSNFGDLSSLSTFNCSKNLLSSLPTSFGNLFRLTELDLSNNNITLLQSCLYTLPALEVLRLNGNKILDFETPQMMSNLVSLHTLNLSNNELTLIPAEISLLTHLSTFQASENNIAEFPYVTGSTSLVSLALNRNSIPAVPLSISNLVNLTSLDISFNDIETLPELGSLPLKQLLFTGNQISEPVTLPPTCIPMVEESCADEIMPNLWLGSLHASDNKHFLLSKQVTHVLSVLPISKDQMETDLLEHFQTCHKFIDEARDSGTAVLVHCAAGVSRSATIVTSYVMYKNNIGYEAALEILRKKRPAVSPNPGFIKQLQQFESTILPTLNHTPKNPCKIM